MNCSLDIITVLDERGVIRFENPAAEQLTGYRPDELIGQFVFDFIHPDDRPATLHAFQGILAEKNQTASAEFRFRNKNGSWQYLAAVAKNLLHESGIAGVIVSSRDVTIQKQAENSLRESEERFRQLTENIDDVFWISDPSITKMHYISPAYEKIWGRTCESVMKLPRSFLDAVHPDDRDVLLANMAATEMGRPYSIEYRITRPDRTVRWIAGRGFPVFDQYGAVYRCAGVAEDITDKVRDRAQLHLQSSALSAAANAIFITDKLGRITWANASFCQLSGFGMEELVDQTPRILKSGKHDVGFYQQLWQKILAGNVWSGEVVERRKNGELYTVYQTITPLSDSGGEITHFIVVHEDITARKDTEARIEHMAYHDALTGLCNRVELLNRLEQAVQQAKRHSRSLALHFIDLDRFKVINDTLGHSVGDALLEAVARRLESCLRRATRPRGSAATSLLCYNRKSPTSRDLRPWRARFSPRWRTRSGWLAATFTFHLASASVSFPWTVASRTSCCKMPTWRCTWPRMKAATIFNSSLRRSMRKSVIGWLWNPTFTRRS